MVRNWILIGICLLLIALGLWWFAPAWQGRVVQIDLYGTSSDGAMRHVEDVLQTVRLHFGSRVRVAVHYLSLRDKDTGALYSLQLKRDDGMQPSPALTAFDLEENQRRLVMQLLDREKFWRYLAFRNDNVADYGWESAALRVGFSPEVIRARVARDGERLQRAEIQAYEAFSEQQGNPSLVLPALFIGGTLYAGTADAVSISSAVARALLRNGASELAAQQPLRLGPVALERTNTTSIFGVTECANDLHCNDRSKEDGFCRDAGTLRARCEYRPPPPVTLVVVARQSENVDDAVLRQMAINFKGLRLARVDAQSPDGVSLLTSLKLKQTPLYLFDQSIKADQRLPALVEASVVTSVAPGWYQLMTNDAQHISATKTKKK